MRVPRIGEVLLTVGAGVGLAAVVGLVVGFEPSKLPAPLLNVAAYKLTFAAAAGLLAAGAVVQRYARREDREHSADTAGSPTATKPEMLGEGPADLTTQATRDAPLGVDVRQAP